MLAFYQIRKSNREPAKHHAQQFLIFESML